MFKVAEYCNTIKKPQASDYSCRKVVLVHACVACDSPEHISSARAYPGRREEVLVLIPGC